MEMQAVAVLWRCLPVRIEETGASEKSPRNYTECRGSLGFAVSARRQWDERKAVLNFQKHGVTFYEARAALYNDPEVHVIPDVLHSFEEDRFLAIARTGSGDYLTIVYTIRNDREWLISARYATLQERRRYMKGDRIREAAVVLRDSSRPLPAPGERITATIVIDDDVARFYYLNHEVEDALRALIADGRAPEPGPPIVPPPSAMDPDDWGPEEVDFDSAPRVPNPFYRPGNPRLVFIDGQLLRWFGGDAAINDALRTLIAEGRVPPRRNE